MKKNFNIKNFILKPPPFFILAKFFLFFFENRATVVQKIPQVFLETNKYINIS